MRDDHDSVNAARLGNVFLQKLFLELCPLWLYQAIQAPSANQKVVT